MMDSAIGEEGDARTLATEEQYANRGGCALSELSARSMRWRTPGDISERSGGKGRGYVLAMLSFAKLRSRMRKLTDQAMCMIIVASWESWA